MARRATAIKQELAKASSGVTLILDAGSALVGAWEASKSLGQVTVASMNLMAYDAMAVGRMDLAIGLDEMRMRQEEATFPFLSANIADEESAELFFDPYVVLDRQGLRIAIIGLSEPEAIVVPLLKVRAKVLEPAAAIEGLVAELRPEVDLVVVLSHLGLDPDKALAEAIPGIDIIIGGNTRQLMNAPERVGNTLVVQQGYRGEWVGKLTATFDAEGVPSAFAEAMLTLGEEYADDPEQAALVKRAKELYPQPTPEPTPTSEPTPAPSIEPEQAYPKPAAVEAPDQGTVQADVAYPTASAE